MEDAEDGRCSVTFLWRDRHGSGGGTSSVVLVANRLTDPTVMADSVLHRLARTDVWYRSYRLPSTFRATYLFAPEDGRVAQDPGSWTGAAARWRGLVSDMRVDPLNPRTFPERDGASVASVVALPDAPADDWATPRPGVAAGTVSEHRVQSAILGTSRRVWAHVAAGAPVSGASASGVPGSGAPVLVLFDGEEWVGRLGAPALLDNLVAAGRIPPVVTLMPEAISPRDRAADLAPGAPFARFVLDELLPWARETLDVTADPARTFVAGQSLGGLAALALALDHPGRFAGVVAQSASVWWAPPGAAPRDAPAGGPASAGAAARDAPAGGPASAGAPDACWAVERCAAATLDGLRVHLEVGTLEWVLVEDTRRLRDALTRAGARVSATEFAGGHEALCWRAGLADALAGVLSAGA